MKIFLLKAKDTTTKKSPWGSPYDKVFGFVICAEDESSARAIAHINSGDETTHDTQPWLDAEYTSCEELAPRNTAQVILCDFNAG